MSSEAPNFASPIDITAPVTADLAVWPGDNPPTREVLMDFTRGDHLALSTLRTTVHLGTHADAPSHTDAQGAAIEASDLSVYLGACQVVRVDVARGARIGLADLADEITAPRVLFKTGTFPDPESWNADFAALEPALIQELASRGVCLIGIDTPSVDLSDSKELPSHAACVGGGVAILEGLRLGHVDPGEYTLIALPLALVGFDASPIRAVLLR